jgi:hypothetical protein
MTAAGGCSDQCADDGTGGTALNRRILLRSLRRLTADHIVGVLPAHVVVSAKFVE